MGFPTEKELKIINDLAENMEADFVIGPDASLKDKIKYDLCQVFVSYMVENGLTQTDLANKLEIPQPRVSEVVKCKIHLFTIDRLVEYHSKLFPDQEIELSQKVS